MAPALPLHWTWYVLPRAGDSAGNTLQLLRGGDELFPAMRAAIEAAEHEVWLATYIFHTDATALALLGCLSAAARRGVAVHIVIDGFGSLHSAAALAPLCEAAGIRLAVFRPLRRLAHWLNPGQLRRLHMKLCAVDGRIGFAGGINLIDDHIDLRHGRSEAPRLDYAARVEGPAAQAIAQATRAIWSRAAFGRSWRAEARRLLARAWRDDLMRRHGQFTPPGAAPPPLPARSRLAWLKAQLRLWQAARGGQGAGQPGRSALAEPATPAHDGLSAGATVARLVVRDNLRQRRAIEQSYITALASARERVLLVCPYFYPGGEFRRALIDAARRGVRVSLLLQGKVDYRLAALAAQALYDELLGAGVAIHEYTPAFLHAKVAVVDQHWATVGSSNIDPLSLLLNLEANLVVRDPQFCAALASAIELDLAQARPVSGADPLQQGWRGWPGLVRRALVAWVAHVYLRVAGVTGRY
ncbi:MAG: cardiolipin synthase ClsB [Pseudomonadota bacterium]|jgi:cardiolipin synthase